MLEECGLSYETPALDMMNAREHKSEKFLKLNPNGKVPCLVDGTFTIWESAAIVTYLAEKYKPEFLGKTPEEKGHITQWMFWAMTEAQPPMVDILIQKHFVPEGKKDEALIEKRMAQIPHLLQILDGSLKDKTYLVGNRFTTADLVACSVVNIADALGLQLKEYQQISRWLGLLKERPAFQKILKMREQK
jgi:glutathione S-transferase